MNQLLITLLYLNGQIKSFHFLTLPAKAKKPRKLSPFSVVGQRGSPPGDLSLKLEAIGGIGTAPSNRLSANILGLWITGLTASVIIIVLDSISGGQQIALVRERIRWSRLVQEKEQEIQQLKRQQQGLKTIIADQAAQWSRLETLRPASATGPWVASANH